MILLIGGRGQLGQAFQNALSEAGRKFELAPSVQYWPLDWPGEGGGITDDCEAVINCAAYTDVRAAEKPENWNSVFYLNTTFPARLAQACERIKKPLITFSTDYVFGWRGRSIARAPREPAEPLNVYGQTKYAGEVLMKNTGAVIIRTAGLFSPYGPNFVSTIFDKISRYGFAEVRTDLVTSVTSADNLARSVARYLINPSSVQTLYPLHYVDSDPVTWYQVAEEVEKHVPGRGAARRLIERTPDDLLVTRPRYSALFPTMPGPMNWREEVARVCEILKARNG